MQSELGLVSTMQDYLKLLKTSQDSSGHANCNFVVPKAPCSLHASVRIKLRIMVRVRVRVRVRRSLRV